MYYMREKHAKSPAEHLKSSAENYDFSRISLFVEICGRQVCNSVGWNKSVGRKISCNTTDKHLFILKILKLCV